MKNTKSKQNPYELKKQSIQSIILRTLALSRILCENFNFSFVFKKEQRIAMKTLSYYPIEKIYDDNSQIIFDENAICLKGNKKTRYCRSRVLHDMIEALRKKDYRFNICKTNSSITKINSIKFTTIEKIKSFSYTLDGKENKFDMNWIETTIGKSLYNELKNSLIHPYDKVYISCNGKEPFLLKSYQETSVIHIPLIHNGVGRIETRFEKTYHLNYIPIRYDLNKPKPK